jgi:hypothetical protein
MAKRLWSMAVAGLLSYGLASAEASPVFFGGTGSYYDFIAGSLTWDAARVDATAQTYLGISGHLATLTSLQEDQFIRTTFATQTNNVVGPWIGADWDGSGWHWVTGEAFVYSGWNAGEPSFDGDAIHFSGGGWNDVPRTSTGTIGYLVEFSVPEPSSVFLLAIALLATIVARSSSVRAGARATKR